MKAEAGHEDEIDIARLWGALWSGRYIVILVTGLFTLAGVIYALNARQVYRAEIVLAPAGDKGMAGSFRQFGGLASLAGINIPSGGTQEPLAVLKSKDFAREFITGLNLMPVLLPEKTKTGKPLDIRDAVEVLDTNVRSVIEDKKTGLVTLAVHWKDPTIASQWANELVKRLNDRLRNQALRESEHNVEFLQKQIAATAVVSLQQSLGRVLETEMQKYMLARGNEEFAFKVIDRATPPKQRYSPRRAQIVISSTIAGGFLSVLSVFLWQFIADKRLQRRR